MSVYLDSHGHHVEINKNCDKSGKIQELSIWCHTCDPYARSLRTVSVSEYDNYHEAASAALVGAREHVWAALRGRVDSGGAPLLG